MVRNTLHVLSIAALIIQASCGGSGGGGGGEPVSQPIQQDEPTEQPSQSGNTETNRISISAPFYDASGGTTLRWGLGVTAAGDSALLAYSRDVDVVGDPVDVESLRYSSVSGWSSDPETITPRPNNKVVDTSDGVLMFNDGTALLTKGSYASADGLRYWYHYSPSAGWTTTTQIQHYTNSNNTDRAVDLFDGDVSANSSGNFQGVKAPFLGSTVREIIRVDKLGNELSRSAQWRNSTGQFDQTNTLHPSESTEYLGELVEHKLMNDDSSVALFNYKRAVARAPRPGDAEQTAYINYVVRRTVEAAGGAWANPDVIYESEPDFDRNGGDWPSYRISAAGQIVEAIDFNQGQNINFTDCSEQIIRLADSTTTPNGHAAYVSRLECDGALSVFLSRKFDPATELWSKIYMISGFSNDRRDRIDTEIVQSNNGKVIIVFSAPDDEKFWSIEI